MPKSLAGRADYRQFRDLVGKTSKLSPALKTALRKRIRVAAQVAAQDAQDTVRNGPTTGDVSTGLRDDIAAGIKVSIMAGQNAGVVIRSGAGNQAHPRSVVKAYDRAKGWRHPVFGNTDVWVRQFGQPYFASVIDKHRDEITKSVLQAMTDAGETLK